MPTPLPIDQMTLEEKLRTMEALWADLSRTESQIESPPWHEQVLKDRAARVASGTETFVDWESAKRELRQRLT